MDESFEIPVIYKGEQLHFTGWLLVQGYSHKFKVMIDGQEVFFEPDDTGGYRAMLAYDSAESLHKNTPVELLQAIAGAIQSLVK